MKTKQLALGVLKNIRQSLHRANTLVVSPICDTIWHTPHETLFDYIDSSITALEADIAQPVEPVDCQFQGRDGRWCGFINESTRKTPLLTGRGLYAIYTTPPEPVVNEQPVGFTGISVEADFSTDKWTFQMDPGYAVSAGRYMITKVEP